MDRGILSVCPLRPGVWGRLLSAPRLFPCLLAGPTIIFHAGSQLLHPGVPIIQLSTVGMDAELPDPHEDSVEGVASRLTALVSLDRSGAAARL